MIKGQYTPLNLNCLGKLMQNEGLMINATQQSFMGVSTSATTYTTRGTVYTSTLLNKLADVTALAFSKIGSGVTLETYNALISMGSSSIPALGNSKPSTYTNTYTGEMTKYGWLRLIPYQAHTEFYLNSGSYSDFLNTFNACEGFKSTSNSLISNYSSSTTFLKTTFSNINDLISSDITGVSLATLYWGQDLIKTGRAIDLTKISKFGLPSVLLKTLSLNRALTPSLNVALLSAGFTSTDIDSMLLGNATLDQEKLLYASFSIIVNSDLADICVLLNCQTAGLTKLSDLLDPKKLFPNSYKTLTFPKYNQVNQPPTNSKTYYPIYIGDQTDTALTPTIGLRLINILPESIACACDAFSISMLQIKNIQSMEIQAFSQVVTNLENCSGMDTGTATYPINPDIALTALAEIANGSGVNNTYTTCDFFGAMTNLHYDFETLQSLIEGLSAAGVSAKYDLMYSLLSGAGPYESALISYINDVNTEIASILTGNPVLGQKLNTLYDTFGTQLTKEQNARAEALPFINDLTTTRADIFSFMSSLNEFATQTQDKGPGLVLENIANTTTIGGNSLIGSMREIRNSERLGLIGGQLDSNVDNSPLILPRKTGTTSRQSPVEGYTPSTNCAADIPIVTGAATTPGSFAGSPEVSLIPPNLSIFNTGIKCSVLTPQAAIDEVIKCNCDCWDNLQ